jgi:hypothetical protein
MLVQDQGRGTVMKRLISLLAAATAVVMLALPGFAQSSYTWELDCSGANGAGTGVSVLWLNNGQPILPFDTTPPNMFVGCVSPVLSGSAVIPTSINGIQVNGIYVQVSLDEYPAGCSAFASVTKSFDPSNPKILINESVKAPGTTSSVFGGPKLKCPAASFSFTLKS